MTTPGGEGSGTVLLNKDQQTLNRLAEAPEALDQPQSNLYLLAQFLKEDA